MTFQPHEPLNSVILAGIITLVQDKPDEYRQSFIPLDAYYLFQFYRMQSASLCFLARNFS